VRTNSHGSPRATFGLEFHAGRANARVPFTRFLGVEIEVARIGNSSRNTLRAIRDLRITVGEDGSLPSGGFEIRCPPAGGSAFETRMTALLDALRDDAAEVDRSCGLHVHVDTRDFSEFCLRKIALVWEAIEQGLLDMFPPDRYRNSGYCYPVRDKLTKTYRGKPLPTAPREAMREAKKLVKEVFHAQHRYATLNTSSLAKYGTVEVRLHPGSVKHEEIIPWSILCGGIVEQAFRMPERDALRFAELTPYEAALRIAPTQETRDYIERMWAKNATKRVSVGATAAEAISRFPVLTSMPPRQKATYCALCQRYHTERVGRDFTTAADAVDAGYEVADAPAAAAQASA
jgi:hypothetical protein